jgi:putative membrane protein
MIKFYEFLIIHNAKIIRFKSVGAWLTWPCAIFQMQTETEFFMKIRYALIALAAAVTLGQGSANAQSPADLNDLQIAHVAYVADNIDIRYAHLALAISQNPDVRAFAETMIRDHSAVNEQALALLAKLNAQPQDNFLSQSLQDNAEKLIDEMSKLRGAEFDRHYAENELAYHKAVNDLVGNAFIPNIENVEVKALFEAGLAIFQAHEGHAVKMVGMLK